MGQPNIITILADDLGYSDLGCFGGEIDTPNLDRLAGRGVRMSSFYVTPRCSPSRAALLTGRHPHSVGIGILTSDDRPHGYRGALSTEVPTVAQRLREYGYRTGLVGKWHLSSDVHEPNDTWPTRRGFDEFYGFLPGCGSYYQPRMHRGEERVPAEEFAASDYYITDDLSERAVEFVTRAAEADEPFFLYLAHPAPHWPLHAPEEVVAKYRARFRAGWDELRATRHRRQAALGLDLTPELPPRDDVVPAWDDAGDHEWQVERMAVYAAQVEIMDRGIGLLLDTLEGLGIADDTLVTFSSDNGACEEQLPEPGDWRFPETICPLTTRTGEPVQVGNTPGLMPGPETTYASYGRPWANLSNTPFRLYKRWVHEGGIASAFVASWPDGRVGGGRLVEDPGHVIDLVPTLMDAVGAEVDAPGTSLLSAWRGDGGPDTERDMFWEHIGNCAIRRGRYKLVREAHGPWELFDLVEDRGELRDLSGRLPELADELETAWHEWARENGVIPWDSVLADYAARGKANAGHG